MGLKFLPENSNKEFNSIYIHHDISFDLGRVEYTKFLKKGHEMAHGSEPNFRKGW